MFEKRLSHAEEHGYFQYTADDGKHQVKLQDRNLLGVYFEYKEMLKGIWSLKDYNKSENAVWSSDSMGNAQIYQALNDYGDRLDTVGIFHFWGRHHRHDNERGTSVSSFTPYRTKWPIYQMVATV